MRGCPFQGYFFSLTLLLKYPLKDYILLMIKWFFSKPFRLNYARAAVGLMAEQAISIRPGRCPFPEPAQPNTNWLLLSPPYGHTWILKHNISCQNRGLTKGFSMKNEPNPRIRFVCYGLKCSVELRLSRITSRRKKVTSPLEMSVGQISILIPVGI